MKTATQPPLNPKKRINEDISISMFKDKPKQLVPVYQNPLNTIKARPFSISPVNKRPVLPPFVNKIKDIQQSK